MRNIYTRLSQAEIDAELTKVLDSSSLVVEVRSAFKAMGHSSDEVLALPAHKVRPFLDLIAANIKLMYAFALQHSKVVSATKLLTKHSDESVRNWAIKLHTIARSAWAAAQAATRTQPRSE